MARRTKDEQFTDAGLERLKQNAEDENLPEDIRSNAATKLVEWGIAKEKSASKAGPLVAKVNSLTKALHAKVGELKTCQEALDDANEALDNTRDGWDRAKKVWQDEKHVLEGRATNADTEAQQKYQGQLNTADAEIKKLTETVSVLCDRIPKDQRKAVGLELFWKHGEKLSVSFYEATGLYLKQLLCWQSEYRNNNDTGFSQMLSQLTNPMKFEDRFPFIRAKFRVAGRDADAELKEKAKREQDALDKAENDKLKRSDERIYNETANRQSLAREVQDRQLAPLGGTRPHGPGCQCRDCAKDYYIGR